MEAPPNGSRIRVYWPAMRRFYAGKVFKDDIKKGIYRLHYDDGEVHYIKLAQFRWEYEKQKAGKKEDIKSLPVVNSKSERRQKPDVSEVETGPTAGVDHCHSELKPCSRKKKRMRLVSELIPPLEVKVEEPKKNQAKRQKKQPSSKPLRGTGAAAGKLEGDRQRQLLSKREPGPLSNSQIVCPALAMDSPTNDTPTSRKKPQRILLPSGNEGTGGADTLQTPLGPRTPAAAAMGLNARHVLRANSPRVTACRTPRPRFASLLGKPRGNKGVKSTEVVHALTAQHVPEHPPKEADSDPVGGCLVGNGRRAQATEEETKLLARAEAAKEETKLPAKISKDGPSLKGNASLGRSSTHLAEERAETGRQEVVMGRREQKLCRNESVLQPRTGIANHAEGEVGAVFHRGVRSPAGTVMWPSVVLLQENEKAAVNAGQVGGKVENVCGPVVGPSSVIGERMRNWVSVVEEQRDAKPVELGGWCAMTSLHGRGAEERGFHPTPEAPFVSATWSGSCRDEGLQLGLHEDDDVSWDGVEQASEWSELSDGEECVSGCTRVGMFEGGCGGPFNVESDGDASRDSDILSLASVLVQLQEGGRRIEQSHGFGSD